MLSSVGSTNDRAGPVARCAQDESVDSAVTNSATFSLKEK